MGPSLQEGEVTGASRQQVRENAARRLRILGMRDDVIAAQLRAFGASGYFDRFPVDSNAASTSGSST